MTTTQTLSQTGSAILDSTGSATITLRPDVNQNWAPLFVRVSTGLKTSPVAYCAVYHGSPGVNVQQSQFIDDTFLASGDTSSIIAGTPIVYGQAVIFAFSGGTPGDTAIATVYGMTSDTPPNLDLNPQVPGTHFTGHLITEIVTLIAKSSGSNIIPGGEVTTGLIIDVRQWASYYLSLDATVSTLPATDYNQIQVALFWTADALGATRLSADSFSFWADALTGKFVSLSTVFAEDVMHGPFMRINILNNGTNDVDVQWRLLGTTRVLPGPYLRQGSFPDGIVLDVQIDSMVAGVADVPLPLAYGPMELVITNNGGNPEQFTLNFEPNLGTGPGFPGYLGQVAVGGSLGVNPRLVVIAPKRGGILHVAGVGGDQFSIRAITDIDKV